MNELKEKVLNMVLESKDVDYSRLNDLVTVLHQSDDYIEMLTKFYLSFFVTTHQIPIESLVEDIGKVNLFQIKTAIEEVAKEVSLEKELDFYVELLKEMNKNYQSNAVEVIKGMLNSSEEVIGNVMTQIKELTNIELKE